MTKILYTGITEICMNVSDYETLFTKYIYFLQYLISCLIVSVLKSQRVSYKWRCN